MATVLENIPVYCSISVLRVLQNNVFTGKEGTNSAGVCFAGAGTDYRGKRKKISTFTSHIFLYKSKIGVRLVCTADWCCPCREHSKKNSVQPLCSSQ